MEDSRPTPSVVIAAYAQSFVDGRKVVVFGDCTSGLAERLIERGARLVHVYDADLVRVTEASARANAPNILYAPLGQSGVAVREGTFDVGIIEDLAAAEDPAQLVKRLRRTLAARGVGFVASPNFEVEPQLLRDSERSASGPSYYELFELINHEFSEVRMVGQTPFVGFALADFSPERAEEFSIDTEFVPGGAEEPEWYLAVASHFPVEIDPFFVVQLPAADVLEEPAPPAPPTAQLEAANQLEARERELQAARHELQPVRQELQAVRHELQAAKQELQAAGQELQAAKQELESREAWVSELEARSAAADERADQAEARGDALESELTALKDQLEQLSKAMEQTHRRSEELLGERAREQQETLAEQRKREDEQAQAHAKLEQRLAELQAVIEGKDAELADTAAAQESLIVDLDRCEAQLRERGQALETLKRELRRTEQLAEQLLSELETLRGEGATESGDAGTSSANGASGAPTSAESAHRAPAAATEPEAVLRLEGQLREVQQRLEELTRVDALRVADLTAAQWTVQELESKLGDAREAHRLELEQLRGELQQKLVLLEQLQRPTPETASAAD